MLCVAMLVVSLAALMPALASAATHKVQTVRFGTRTLKVGMSGTDVSTLQHDLTSLGWSTAASGTFNAVTRNHVKLFQKKNHLSVDGVVGPLTYTVIAKAMSKYEDTGNTPATGATASASSATLSPEDSGGAGFVPANNSPSAPVAAATLNADGTATAPAGAPTVIVNAIAAANKIAFDPYVYGGGHNGWGPQSGYDCSGTVSYVLHAAGLLNGEPLDSTQFESYGQRGAGQWITIYADSGHAWMTIAGLTFDTVNQSSSNGDDRWSGTPDSWETNQVKNGTYVVVHPAGW